MGFILRRKSDKGTARIRQVREVLSELRSDPRTSQRPMSPISSRPFVLSLPAEAMFGKGRRTSGDFANTAAVCPTVTVTPWQGRRGKPMAPSRHTEPTSHEVCLTPGKLSHVTGTFLLYKVVVVVRKETGAL